MKSLAIIYLLAMSLGTCFAGLEEGTLNIGEGKNVHYFSSGAKEKELILFLHGNPETAHSWNYFLEQFGANYHAVAMDLTGIHPSYRPWALEAYGYKQVINDIETFVKKLGHKKAHVVGHDIGGTLAWALAIEKRKLVDRLVVINSPHPYVFAREYHDPRSEQKSRSQYILQIRGGELGLEQLKKDNYKVLTDLVFDYQGPFNVFYAIDANRQYLKQSWRDDGTLISLSNFYKAGDFPPPKNNFLVKLLTKVRPPTLVIWGKQDPYLVNGNLHRLEDSVKDLTIVTFENATHWVHHERQAEVALAIHNFLY